MLDCESVGVIESRRLMLLPGLACRNALPLV